MLQSSELGGYLPYCKLLCEILLEILVAFLMVVFYVASCVQVRIICFMLFHSQIDRFVGLTHKF